MNIVSVGNQDIICVNIIMTVSNCWVGDLGVQHHLSHNYLSHLDDISEVLGHPLTEAFWRITCTMENKVREVVRGMPAEGEGGGGRGGEGREGGGEERGRVGERGERRRGGERRVGEG